VMTTATVAVAAMTTTATETGTMVVATASAMTSRAHASTGSLFPPLAEAAAAGAVAVDVVAVADGIVSSRERLASLGKPGQGYRWCPPPPAPFLRAAISPQHPTPVSTAGPLDQIASRQISTHTHTTTDSHHGIIPQTRNLSSAAREQ
jgi:hypothetical protein